MADFLFIFFRSPIDETDDDTELRSERWSEWVNRNKTFIRDAGGMLGSAWTVSHNEETFLGREFPSTAYMIVRAASRKHALALAGSCPEVALGGSIEVAELHRDVPNAANHKTQLVTTTGQMANRHRGDDTSVGEDIQHA